MATVSVDGSSLQTDSRHKLVALKGCCSVLEIVTECVIEIRLFQFTLFHYAEKSAKPKP